MEDRIKRDLSRLEKRDLIKIILSIDKEFGIEAGVDQLINRCGGVGKWILVYY